MLDKRAPARCPPSVARPARRDRDRRSYSQRHSGSSKSPHPVWCWTPDQYPAHSTTHHRYLLVCCWLNKHTRQVTLLAGVSVGCWFGMGLVVRIPGGAGGSQQRRQQYQGGCVGAGTCSSSSAKAGAAWEAQHAAPVQGAALAPERRSDVSHELSWYLQW